MTLRDRVIETVEGRGELVLYRLNRPTGITCARCAGPQVTRLIAVLAGRWTSLWCRSYFQAMPVPPAVPNALQGPPPEG